MINYTPGQQQPIVTREEYLRQQQQCSLLTDVSSQMSRDWINGGRAFDHPDYSGSFDWTPRNDCEIDKLTNNPIKFEDYTISQNNLIWTAFKYGPLPTSDINIHIEPAAMIAYVNGRPDTAYLAFRGSQTGADFGLDAQYSQVVNPLKTTGGGNIMKGFSKYFVGLGINAEGTRPENTSDYYVPGKTLWNSLKDISYLHGGAVKHLIVTGHSLGSTTATLSCAFACQQGWFETVVGSVSASPRVGTAFFKNWFDDLRDNSHRMLNDRFWRLTNTADGVPNLPGAPYTEVGNAVTFTAENGEEHNPCCTYSYAINHPILTNNPFIATCTFPKDN